LVYVGELHHSYTSDTPKTFTTPYAQYSQGTSLERLQLMSLIYSLGAFRIGIPSVAAVWLMNTCIPTMDRLRMVANGTGEVTC